MDHTEEERDFARLARRIADGMQIDWEHESREGTTTADQIRHLKLVERISDAHRDLLLEELPFESWGPLDLKRAAATGGFGDVFLARDRNLDSEVALKLFAEEDDSAAHESFVDEARRLASVRHVNVVTIHGVDRHEGRSGLWMDWIDGDTLETLVDDQGPYAAAEAVRIGVELCGALAAIHAAGLVHRDVKSSNVMRERGGRIVLMDFGSSTRSGSDGSQPLSGTPVYLSPEAYEGVDSGVLMDIYSLGVLLYRLTSGSYPLEFGTVAEMRQAHRDGKLVPLRDRNPDLPVDFVRVVERAMHPDPDRRFASVGEMERALTEVHDAPGPTPEPTPEPTPLWKRAPMWAAALLLAVVAVAYVVDKIPASPFTPEAEFYRFTEQATEERLVSGVRIRPGDQLFLEFESEHPSWVYVINADAAGDQNLLFPSPAIEATNPLPPGTHRFPGVVAGETQYWDVTSAGGEELLLVVASTTAIDFIEEQIADLRPVVPGGPLLLPEGGVVSELRGIAGMSPAPNGERQVDSPLRREIVDGVALRSGDGGGIRLWELTLFNPE